jgi:hypothetical protein
MIDDARWLEDVRYWLFIRDSHTLAEVLKLCAAEIQHRKLPGHQLVYDVAFEIHALAAHASIGAHVERYLDPPPS